MNSTNQLLSSDDSDAPILRAHLKRAKPVSYKAELTSDSDSEPIKFVKVKTPQTEKLLGEISLLTSDEEFIPEPSKFKKKPLSKTNTREKRIHTIELITSDEDMESANIPSNTGKKRKCLNSHLEVTSPTKKAKKDREAKPLRSKTLSKTRRTAVATSQSSKTDKTLNSSVDDVCPTWQEPELLAEKTLIDESVARNLIKLWEDGNTIPFIARYRRNVIGDMTAENLRAIKEDYVEICELKKKICTVAKAVAQNGKLDLKIQQNICASRTIEELEHIYAPFKPGKKQSLVERAKKCGLEEPALHLLNNTGMIFFADYKKPGVDGIKTEEDVKKGIIQILAFEIGRDPELLLFLRNLRGTSTFKLRTTKARSTQKNQSTVANKIGKKDPKTEEAKFQIYFDFSNRVDALKSHQILAINRGESLKILTVKIEIPSYFQNQFKIFCTNKWTNKSQYDQRRQDIINLAIDDAFGRIITPLISREIRAELKLKAEKESCKVFSDNLKHLLLTRPMKGKPIMGIDPGYTHGCKVALISATGNLLDHSVIYPHTFKNGSSRGEDVIKKLLLQYGCNLIAIGNGSACRETEEWISGLISSHYFGNLDVQYTIVNEDGASIYSCSTEAQKEFRDLDPNIISAVSLARRIQDPMAELVKVEPCHLGVGMYQLDIKKKQLQDALSEVVSECVSFVGVDLNTASMCLLRRIAGLTENKAVQIIDYRERCGAFTHRKELLKVYGIGERVFEQCAGFLRIGPTDPSYNKFYDNKLTTPLDATIIHPESYPLVRSLIGELGLKEKQIGSEYFIRCFKAKSQGYDIQKLAEKYKSDKETMHLIFDALNKSLSHDFRTEMSRTPLFKKDITSLENLKINSVLTGRVKNVTSFGAFVDIGVGDVLEVRVNKLDVVKGHINLVVLNKCS
ncbi:hypothetical protein HUJ05_000903 [Dendroctonus ponderosae]|nr:hypothetical protein HUJ05_000903 [Dendroctonus ponderosae]